MYAQITSIEWPLGVKVEGKDEAIQTARDQIVPFAKQQKGFLGLSQEGRIFWLARPKATVSIR